MAAVAAGYLHSVALLSNGTVVVWGDNSFGQTNVPPGLTNVIAIAAGDYHTLALRADGVIIGWGDNSFGQLNVPSVPNPVALASGNYHGLALSARPSLQYRMDSAGLILAMARVGQSSNGGQPPWELTPTSLALSQSYTNTDMTAPAMFFRLRRPE